MSGNRSWERSHQGKRRHATWLAAWWHCLRIRLRYGDRMDPYRCLWTDTMAARGPAHYHAGHPPGWRPARDTDTAPRRRLPQPGRQIIIGFSELQLSTLRSRAAGRGIPWQKYAADIIHAALAEPVPRHQRIPLPFPDSLDDDAWARWRADPYGDGTVVPPYQVLPDAYHNGPADEIIVERCPIHEEPVGDGRHCIACDGGVF